MFGSGIWKGKVKRPEWTNNKHHSDVIMGTMASQTTSLTIVYNNRLERRRSKKTSKLRVTGLCAGIHRWPVNSPHKGPVTRKMFPFDDVIMITTAPLISRNIIFKLWQLPKQPVTRMLSVWRHFRFSESNHNGGAIQKQILLLSLSYSYYCHVARNHWQSFSISIIS